MSTRRANRSSASFAQANGSAFARASFNFILLVIGAVLASIFVLSGVLLRAILIAVVLLVAVWILRVLILPSPSLRPGLSAA